MSRFSPTVLPDSTPRSRPGMEIAQAFGDYRQAQGEEEDRAFKREDRAIAAEDRGIAGEERDRRRGREDLTEAARKIEFEQLVRDVYGGVPIEKGQEVPERAPPGPTAAGGAFEDARMGLAGEVEPSGLQAPIDIGGREEEVVVLPGQFAGGRFSPQAVTTRDLGGQSFRIDPSQSLEGRRAAEGERLSAEQGAALQEEIELLIQAGVDPQIAPAVAQFDLEREFVTPEEEEQAGFDPDAAGAFENREEYLAFQRELADAKDAAGRRPDEEPGPGEGPIDLEGSFDIIDNLFGVWENDVLVDHKLTEAQQLDYARRLASGELTVEDVEKLVAGFGEEGGDVEEEPAFESGPVKRFFQRLLPGGQSGFEQVGGEVGPLEQETEGTSTAATSPRTQATTPTSPAIDTIRALIAENPGVSEDQLRAVLAEQFDGLDIEAAFRRR